MQYKQIASLISELIGSLTTICFLSPHHMFSRLVLMWNIKLKFFITIFLRLSHQSWLLRNWLYDHFLMVFLNVICVCKKNIGQSFLTVYWIIFSFWAIDCLKSIKAFHEEINFFFFVFDKPNLIAWVASFFQRVSCF